MEKQLADLLTQHALRLTTPRRGVFEVLTRVSEPVSIAELARQLPGVDRVSIYRTIELFTKLGITTIVAHGWKQRYELAAPFKPHHHHLHCMACNRHTEIHSKQLESLITALSQEHGFAAAHHHFEISGLCRQCRS